MRNISPTHAHPSLQTKQNKNTFFHVPLSFVGGTIKVTRVFGKCLDPPLSSAHKNALLHPLATLWLLQRSFRAKIPLWTPEHVRISFCDQSLKDTSAPRGILGVHSLKSVIELIHTRKACTKLHNMNCTYYRELQSRVFKLQRVGFPHKN